MSKRSDTRRQLRTALLEIDDLIPVPWDMDLLVRNIAAQRCKPIHLLPVKIPPSAWELSGASWPTPEADIICYDRDASPAVREQTIGHELGHLLMKHRRRDTDGQLPVLELLASMSISPTLIKSFFGRTAYGDTEEAAAEEFGTRLIQAGRRRRGGSDGDALGRLTDSLR